MKFYTILFCISYCIYENYAQYDGGVPQRAIIPGSIPVRQLPQIPGAIPVRGGGRQGRLLVPAQPRRPAPQQVPSFYRASPIPNAPPPQQFTQSISKPVTEEPEDDDSSNEDNFEEQIAQKQAFLAQITPTGESLSSPVPPPSPTPVQFRPEPKIVPQVRQQPARIIPRPDPPIRALPPQPQIIQRARPAPRPAPQQIPVQRDYPTEGNGGRRQKKPVAQILRKYQQENEDGSITWGYENDDGSFKEETIGTDCITRGKYGYVDPDGVRREYTYETGHPCDPEEEQLPEQPQQIQQQQQQPRRPRPQ